MNRHTLICPAAVLSVALLAGPDDARAGAITVYRVADQSDAVQPYDLRPALQGNHIAYRGRVSGVDGLFRKSLVSGTIDTIVLETEEVPGDPGQTFRNIGWPALHDGTVYFTGGRAIGVSDGLFRGDGGVVERVLDHDAWFPSADNAGVAFRDDESAVPNPSAWFLPESGTPVNIVAWGQTLPSGDTFYNCNIGESPALGGDQVVFSAYGSPGNALLRYDTGTAATVTVADHRLAFPGTPDLFTFFRECDTDGARVVFVASSGSVGFGGHIGVFASTVGDEPSDGGAISTIVRDGDPVPGVPGAAFEGFDMVAVDGPHVVFGGYWSGGTGLFVWDGVETSNIVDSDDVLDGVPVLLVEFTHRSLDGNRVVFRARPDSGFDYVYFVAQIGDVVAVGADVADMTPRLIAARNPFRVDTQLSMHGDQAVWFEVLDVQGRRVAGPLEVRPHGGVIRARWQELLDGPRFGTYFVRVTTAGVTSMIKLTAVR